MLVYWGGNFGAKKYLKKLLQYNNKPYCMMYDYIITHETGQCHWLGRHARSKRQQLIWDHTLEIDILHRFKDTLHHARRVTREVDYVGVTRDGQVDIRYSKDKGLHLKVLDRIPVHAIGGKNLFRPLKYQGKELVYDSEDKKKFLDLKYKDTLMYWNILRKQINNKDGKLQRVTLDDVPECPILFPHQCQSNFAFDGVEISEKYKQHVNVVPYKSDLVECARNLLDLIKVHDYSCKNYGEDVSQDAFTLYKNDKKKLWYYLDKNIFEENYKIAEKLHQANVKFEYFDLDKDDFTKRFGVKKMLSRLVTHPTVLQLKTLKDKKTARANYKTITNIAREYVASKGKRDNRL